MSRNPSTGRRLVIYSLIDTTDVKKHQRYRIIHIHSNRRHLEHHEHGGRHILASYKGNRVHTESDCAPVTRSFTYSMYCTLQNSARTLLKGIVQRDLTGVKTRLKRSVLMNYVVAKFAFLILKEHHHETGIKLVSAS